MPKLYRGGCGRWGVDVFSNRQVSDIVFEQLPYTLELIFCCIICSATLGVFLGVYSAARRGSLIDRITAVLSVACVAAPAFVVALLRLLLFAVQLQCFPAIGDAYSYRARIWFARMANCFGRVAILPVVTVLGVGMGILLSQAVFTEIIFARPSLGRLVIDSITTRNYPVVMGGVLISTLVFVCATTIADTVNAVLEPRGRTT